MALPRYFLLLFVGIAAGYAATVMLTSLVFNEASQYIDTVDVERSNSIYNNTATYLLFNLDRLSSPEPKVIVIGASSAAWGLRPDELALRLNSSVANIAIYSSNMTETAQTVDLVYSRIPRSAWRQTTFLLGIWYGQFASNDHQWPSGRTDVDNEALRYGLYRATGLGRIEPKWDQSIMSALALALRPAVLFSKIYQEVSPDFSKYYRGSISAAIREYISEFEWTSQRPEPATGLRQKVFFGVRRHFGKLLIAVMPPTPGFVPLRAPPHYSETAQRNAFSLTASEREFAMQSWSSYMGAPSHWDDSSFGVLSRLAENISQHGSRLVILDLPIPTWHKRGLPYDAEYHRRLALIIPKLTSFHNVSIGALNDKFEDDDFVDAVHPRPRVTPKWARGAAELILKARKN